MRGSISSKPITFIGNLQNLSCLLRMKAVAGVEERGKRHLAVWPTGGNAAGLPAEPTPLKSLRLRKPGARRRHGGLFQHSRSVAGDGPAWFRRAGLFIAHNGSGGDQAVISEITVACHEEVAKGISLLRTFSYLR
jgi:hypothetical protein